MANKVSAIKSIRKDAKRRLRNKGYKSAMRTQIKKALRCMEEQDVEKTRAEFLKAMAIVDRLGSKGILHKRNNARKKSKLHKKFNHYMAQRQGQPTQKENDTEQEQ